MDIIKINSAGTHGRFGELVDRVAGFQYRSLGMGGREGGKEGGREGEREGLEREGGREGEEWRGVSVCVSLCAHVRVFVDVYAHVLFVDSCTYLWYVQLNSVLTTENRVLQCNRGVATVAACG
jgi:hypothetical protein